MRCSFLFSTTVYLYPCLDLQLTIERMGKAEPTEFGTDFLDLCKELDKIKASTETIIHCTLQMLEPNPGWTRVVTVTVTYFSSNVSLLLTCDSRPFMNSSSTGVRCLPEDGTSGEKRDQRS